MGKLQVGYGSEWQLTTYRKIDTDALNRAVGAETGGIVQEWLQPPNGPEWKGLDFLPATSRARQEWPGFWPQTGNVHNWDAVGWIRFGDESRWLLVEAKARLGEIETRCGATHPNSIAMIRAALDSTKAAMGVSPDRDWCEGHYQYANRLAALHFLTAHDVPAHLLFVYFIGDRNPAATCPENPEGWREALERMHRRLGLTGRSKLEARVHELFLPAKVLADIR